MEVWLERHEDGVEDWERERGAKRDRASQAEGARNERISEKWYQQRETFGTTELKSYLVARFGTRFKDGPESEFDFASCSEFKTSLVNLSSSSSSSSHCFILLVIFITVVVVVGSAFSCRELESEQLDSSESCFLWLYL